MHCIKHGDAQAVRKWPKLKTVMTPEYTENLTIKYPFSLGLTLRTGHRVVQIFHRALNNVP
jgi:hypothetical protein